MTSLAELKSQHPEWCFSCGKWHLESGGIHTCFENPILAAILALVQRHEATIAELKAKKCRTWAQGIVWAAAELVRAHGVDTYAEWLLRLGVESADFPSCAEEDLSVLREAFPSKQIPRGLE